jgi:hypothetical protein
VGEVGAAAGKLGDLRQPLHRGAQALAVELGDLALVLGGELLGQLLGAVEQGADRRLVALRGLDPVPLEQVGEIPGDLLQGCFRGRHRGPER